MTPSEAGATPSDVEPGRREVHLVWAMSDNRCIGKDGALPWRLPEDMRHFRRRTVGKPVVMGRATFESIGRPLPKRRNIVLSRSAPESLLGVDGIEVRADLESALVAAWETSDTVCVIGGAQIYAEAMDYADRLFVTEVPGDVHGDVFFPEYDTDAFDEVDRQAAPDESCVFGEYRRRTSARRPGENSESSC